MLAQAVPVMRRGIEAPASIRQSGAYDGRSLGIGYGPEQISERRPTQAEPALETTR